MRLPVSVTNYRNRNLLTCSVITSKKDFSKIDYKELGLQDILPPETVKIKKNKMSLFQKIMKKNTNRRTPLKTQPTRKEFRSLSPFKNSLKVLTNLPIKEGTDLLSPQPKIQSKFIGNFSPKRHSVTSGTFFSNRLQSQETLQSKARFITSKSDYGANSSRKLMTCQSSNLSRSMINF